MSIKRCSRWWASGPGGEEAEEFLTGVIIATVNQYIDPAEFHGYLDFPDTNPSMTLKELKLDSLTTVEIILAVEKKLAVEATEMVLNEEFKTVKDIIDWFKYHTTPEEILERVK